MAVTVSLARPTNEVITPITPHKSQYSSPYTQYTTTTGPPLFPLPAFPSGCQEATPPFWFDLVVSVTRLIYSDRIPQV